MPHDEEDIIDVEVIKIPDDVDQEDGEGRTSEPEQTTITNFRVYTPPAKFDGTQDEFNILVNALEPLHCSYPDGQHIDPRTGLPCRRKKQKHGSCALHAKNTVPAVANLVSPALRERVSQFMADFSAALPQTNIAISELVLQERMAMLDTSESKSFMDMIEQVVDRSQKSLVKIDEELQKSVGSFEYLASVQRTANEDGEANEEETNWFTVIDHFRTINGNLSSLYRAAEIRRRKHDALEALEKANVSSVRVKESASKMDQDRERVISKQHVIQMSAELVDLYLQAIARFVKDPKMKRDMINFVHEASSKLMDKMA